MRISTNAASIALLATTAGAWRATLYTTDNRQLEVHGTVHGCFTIQAIPVGQVKFDPATSGFPDPDEICLYSDVDCKKNSVRGCFGKAKTPVDLPNPGTVKSYKIQG